MKFSDYLIGNQWGQPMYSQVQTPIQPQQMQSIAPQQSMQSSVTDFWIKPNQSAPKKKVETFDVLWMLEKTNQFTQQAIKDNPAPVKREYIGRDKNIIEIKKWIEDSLRETHKLNTLLDMKRYVDDWATLEEIQQDFQDIPQEVIWQIYNEFSFWTKFKDILKLYPELDSIQVPQELSNKYDIRKYFNPLWEAGKTILEAKQRSKEEWSLLTSNPLTQWFMSAIWWAVKWVWDLGAWIVWLSDTINAWAKSVTQWWTIDQYKERPTTTSEDALNIFWWGTTTVWSVFALPAITLVNAGIELLPEEWQRALADSMDWLWDKIAQTPWLKQWMQSLPPDRQAEFKQELANAWVWLLLWLKNKKNIVTDPKTFLKENINPIDIAKNFNENVLWVPKSAGELVEWAMNEAWNKIYTTVKWAKWKLSTMTKWVKWEVSFWDRVIAVMNGLDAETVRKFKDSPDIVKALDEWKITKESIKTDLVSAVDDVLSERNEVWSQYSEVYRNPERFDTKDIIADINSSLSEQWVKIKDNKIIWFDTTKMPWLTDQAKTALKSKYKDTIQTLEWRSDLSVKELHNIRKDLYSTSYQDGFANKKAPWVSKVSDVLNERLKKVPWFKEVDSWYKEAADLVNELKSNVLTKDWDFKGTLKALLWERWAKRMDILEKHFPWLKDKIETLAAYDDYLNTRNRKKVWLYEKAGAGAVAWFTMWWWLGAVIWAMVWPILSDFVRDPKWFKNYIVSKAWDNIANKIELWKKLNVSEKTRVNRALKEIIKNPQAALPYKWELWETTNTIIAPWKDIVTSPQGNFIKWQILDTNNSKNATANTSNIDDNSITTVKKKPVQSDTLASKADEMEADKLANAQYIKEDVISNIQSIAKKNPERIKKLLQKEWFPDNRIQSFIDDASNGKISERQAKNIRDALGKSEVEEEGNLLTNSNDISKSLISKELAPLYEEARKYKSAEEFIKYKITPPKEKVYLYRWMSQKFDPKFDLWKTDAPVWYSTWTDNLKLAEQYAGENWFVYKIELPKSKLWKEIIDKDWERTLFFNNEKKAWLNNVSWDEYLIYNYHDDYSPNLIKQTQTKEQLKQIYEQANKVVKADVKFDTPLHQEARKYKSAEDMINWLEKDGKILYHWWNKQIDQFDLSKSKIWDAVFISKDRWFSDVYAWKRWWVTKIVLDNDAKIIDFSNKSQYDNFIKEVEKKYPWLARNLERESIREWLSKKDYRFIESEKIWIKEALKEFWYDWYTVFEEWLPWYEKMTENIWIINTNKIKTESQLRKIREEANKKWLKKAK